MITCDGKDVGEVIELNGDENGRVYFKARIKDPDMVAKLIDELVSVSDSWIKDGILLTGMLDATRDYPLFEVLVED
jgi:uncharacterized protein (DUF736 family)